MRLLAWKRVDVIEAIGASGAGLVWLVLTVEWDMRAGGRVVSGALLSLSGAYTSAVREETLLKTLLPSELDYTANLAEIVEVTI